MILDRHEKLTAEWHGDSRSGCGQRFQILRGEEVLHSGSFGFIAMKWKKLTGEILKN